MLGLEPPGNMARELALYRRGLFAALGAARLDASAFAFPELSAIAFLNAKPRAVKGSALARGLGGCWAGIKGSFSATRVFVEADSLYLGIEGPWNELRARALEACASLGLEEARESPYAIARGFFLCRDPKAAPDELPTPPKLSFQDCSLVALRLCYRLGAGSGSDSLAAATWSERARSRRRTGASEEPSQRRLRPKAL
jgi:hypothetical protein